MINIKEKIGQRIFEVRKAKGLTRKALADLTTDLKQSRINNWERGVRTPGPEEIKQLAEALEVSPAFLMCLSDEKQSKQEKSISQLIPLYQVCEAKAILVEGEAEKEIFSSISRALLPDLSKEAFALKMQDDSMSPEIRINDIQVIDPLVSPKPGDFVAVKLSQKPEVMICQYKKLSYTLPEFELLTLNDNWPNIKVNEGMEVTILGKVVQNIRGY